MKLLVSHSADVMCKDKQGYTPLHAAALSGQLDVIKYLLRLVVEVMWLVIYYYSCYVFYGLCILCRTIFFKCVWISCRGFKVYLNLPFVVFPLQGTVRRDSTRLTLTFLCFVLHCWQYLLKIGRKNRSNRSFADHHSGATPPSLFLRSLTNCYLHLFTAKLATSLLTSLSLNPLR